MPIRTIAIEKETDYRGGVQRFSNVYSYFGGFFSEANLELAVDRLVKLEKDVHSLGVRFRGARAWSDGGTAAENVMLLTKDLSGTGRAGGSGAMYKESAILVQWECERKDRLGRKKYLRKWLHTQAPLGWPLTGSDPVDQTSLDAFNTQYTNEIELLDIGVADFTPYQLCTATGERSRGASNVGGDNVKGSAYKYLENHRMGDMWRGK
jgi:hypothetical protein